jgi:hypothetical protein
MIQSFLLLVLAILFVIHGAAAADSLRKHRALTDVSSDGAALCAAAADNPSLFIGIPTDTIEGDPWQKTGNAACTYSGTGTPAWCSWQGVTCNTTTHEVVSINLPDLPSSSGTLPSQLGQLSALTWLTLGYGGHGNGLSGTMPSSLWTLTNLQQIDFSRQHHISGTFPSDVTNLVPCSPSASTG